MAGGSLAHLVTRILGREQQPQEVVLEGTIIEGPVQLEQADAPLGVVVFRLDSQPDLEFRQILQPLSTTRKHGERIRVHCRMAGDSRAEVGWTEKM